MHSPREPRRRAAGRDTAPRPPPPDGEGRSPPAVARRARAGTRRIREATSCCGLRELRQELLPALAVHLDAGVGQSAVPQPDPRATVLRLEIELDRRRTGRVDLAVALPAPRVDDATRRIELDELAARDVAVDVQPEHAPGPRRGPRLVAHPLRRTIRLHDVRVHLLRRRVDA